MTGPARVPGPAALRLLIYDRTCRGRSLLPGLSHAWGSGRFLYQALGRLDGGHGAASWAEALDWVAGFKPGRPIAEIQFWGHGRWGEARIGGEVLDVSALNPDHPLFGRLGRVRARMQRGRDGLWWFRTCETFGTVRGHAFARAWTQFFGCRAAGHTHVIGIWQSGLHALLPGEEPDWPVEEGLTAAGRGAPSRPGLANTISFLRGKLRQ